MATEGEDGSDDGRDSDAINSGGVEGSGGQENENGVSEFVVIEKEVMKKLKRDRLKYELRIRGLPLSGNKPELLERLEKAIEDKVKVVGGGKLCANEKKSKKKDDGQKKKAGMGVFADGAYWKILQPDEDAVKEPLNPKIKNVNINAHNKAP